MNLVKTFILVTFTLASTIASAEFSAPQTIDSMTVDNRYVILDGMSYDQDIVCEDSTPVIKKGGTGQNSEQAYFAALAAMHARAQVSVTSKKCVNSGGTQRPLVDSIRVFPSPE